MTEGKRIGKIKKILDEKEKPLGLQILGLNAGKLFSQWPARSLLKNIFRKGQEMTQILLTSLRQSL